MAKKENKTRPTRGRKEEAPKKPDKKAAPDKKEEKKNSPGKVDTRGSRSAPAKKEEAPKKEEKVAFKQLKDPCNLIDEALKKKKAPEEIYKDAFSPDAEACKECLKDFADTAKNCKHNTELAKSMKKDTKKSAGAKKGGAGKPRGEITALGGGVNSGTGKMELLLLRKEGATKDELAACRGAWGSHLASLKKKNPDYEFTVKDGRYYAKKKKG